MMKRFLTAAAAVLFLTAPLSSRADDKAILESGGVNAHHITIMISNGNTLNDIFDGSAAAIGGADTPDAKLAQAKAVLSKFLNNHIGDSSLYWALGTPDRHVFATPNTTIPTSSSKTGVKEFVYMQTGNTGGYDFSCGASCSYSQADGVLERWGSETYANAATMTDSVTTLGTSTTYVVVGRAGSSSNGSWPVNYGPYGCSAGCGGNSPYTVYLTMPNDPSTGKKAQIVETMVGGHYYDSNFTAATTVQIKKVYQTCNGTCSTVTSGSWKNTDTAASVNYVYKWGFVGTGGGVGSNGGGEAGPVLPDNGNNTLTDDRNGTPSSTNCTASGWDGGPSTFPQPFTEPSCLSGLASVPWGTTPSGNIAEVLSQLRTLDAAINFNSTSGSYTLTDTNSLEDIVSPAGKTCVGNTIKGGLNALVSAAQASSCIGNTCTDYPVIWVSDSLVAQDNTDPCKSINAGIPVYSIYYGTQPSNSGLANSWITTLPACTGGKAFVATNATELLSALEAALVLIDQNTKDFASATVSSVQTGTDQMAFLATFNASASQAIWNGRVQAYELNSSGNISLGTRIDTIKGTTGNTYTQNSNVPSNATTSLKWNAGANLAAMSTVLPANGSGNYVSTNDTLVKTQLTAGASLTVGTYTDDTNSVAQVTTPYTAPTPSYTTIPTFYWPGRYIIYAQENATAGTVPESSLSFITPTSYPVYTSCNTTACAWYKLKTSYLGLSVTSSNTNDTEADEDLRFIRGDRNNVVTTLNNAVTCDLFGKSTNGALPCVVTAQEGHLYNLYANGLSNGESKLGDVFHSTPVVIGQPHKNAFYTADLNPDGATGHDYQSFFNKYYRRRQVMFTGANDGLFHAFDIGAYDRGIGLSVDLATGLTAQNCPNGTSATSATNTSDGCYDLGTGAEMFAYAPRAIMSSYDQLAQFVGFTGFPYEWTVDGEATDGAAFISNNSSSVSTRNWRSVIVGCMREGSRAFTTSASLTGYAGSYFALDVTQPDSLPAFVPANGATPSSYTGLPSDSTKSPGCIGSPSAVQSTLTAGCAADSVGSATEYPRVLWEFNDTASNGVPNSSTNPGADLDASTEIGTGYPDLGETWSKPALGRIEIPCGNSYSGSSCTAESTPNNVHKCLLDATKACDDKYVAVFGGGFDSNRHNRSGNWIYVMDIETGNVLFKTNKGTAGTGGTVASGTSVPFAAIPGGPLAIDYNLDGYLDYVYFGDLNGNMWRMSLKGDPSTVTYNASATTTVGGTTYGTRQSIKISSTASLAGAYKPFLFYQDDRSTTTVDNTCASATYSYCTELAATCLTAGVEGPCTSTTGPPRSIYYSPTAVYIGNDSNGLPILGIAFSSGERDDIQGTNGSAPASNYQTYRFVYVVDTPSTPTVTYVPSSLTNITSIATQTISSSGSVTYAMSSSCTVNAAGWYIPLPGNSFTDSSGKTMIGERGISAVNAVNGQIYFSTFTPSAVGQSTINNNGTTQTVCTQSGIARLWTANYQLCYGVTGAATGSEFASNPISYVDSSGDIHIIDATEAGGIYQATSPGHVTSKVKNWKEQ